MFENLLRWVRVRGLAEGKMQVGRVEGLPNDARDAVQRPQDYGFAGNPIGGEGLRLEMGGHTVIIRLDRLAERPQLEPYEVAVWHKEGHMIRLRAGKLVQVDCDRLVVNAAQGVDFNTPMVKTSDAITVGTTLVAATSVGSPTVVASQSLVVAGAEMRQHRHYYNIGGVQTETDVPRSGLVAASA